MTTRCKACGARLTYAGKGRPRVHCTRCRPAGAAAPRRVSSAVLSTKRARERAGTAARGAAYRAVALAHPDEYRAELARERLQRGLA